MEWKLNFYTPFAFVSLGGSAGGCMGCVVEWMDGWIADRYLYLNRWQAVIVS